MGSRARVPAGDSQHHDIVDNFHPFEVLRCLLLAGLRSGFALKMIRCLSRSELAPKISRWLYSSMHALKIICCLPPPGLALEFPSCLPLSGTILDIFRRPPSPGPPLQIVRRVSPPGRTLEVIRRILAHVGLALVLVPAPVPLFQVPILIPIIPALSFLFTDSILSTAFDVATVL